MDIMRFVRDDQAPRTAIFRHPVRVDAAMQIFVRESL